MTKNLHFSNKHLTIGQLSSTHSWWDVASLTSCLTLRNIAIWMLKSGQKLAIKNCLFYPKNCQKIVIFYQKKCPCQFKKVNIWKNVFGKKWQVFWESIDIQMAFFLKFSFLLFYDVRSNMVCRLNFSLFRSQLT